jgi:hypothetical protein
MPVIEHLSEKEKTLLYGMLISIFACCVTSYAFYLGKTTVQLVDLSKRIIETFSVIAAYAISMKY